MHCVVQPYSGEICVHYPGTRRAPRHKCFLGSHACICSARLFFGKQAAARGIGVWHPKCACGVAGVRASLAPLSGRVAGIEWRQSADPLGSLRQSGQLSYAVPRQGPAMSNALRGTARRRWTGAATAKAWCLWQRRPAKGITCHAPSQGSFASFFQGWKEGFMLLEVEVAFIVQPGLVPKQFLQGNGLSLYFLG